MKRRITVEADEELHRLLRKHCIDKNTTMREFVIETLCHALKLGTVLNTKYENLEKIDAHKKYVSKK